MRTVSPLSGTALAAFAATAAPRTILDVGDGLGATALWLRRGAPEAHITIVTEDGDTSVDAARFVRAGSVDPSRLRLITGFEDAVLPRLRDAGYDLVVLGDDHEQFAARLAHALRLVRPGGTVLALGALGGGAVADPARRDPITRGLRAILAELFAHPSYAVTVLPTDGGMLTVTRLASSPAPHDAAGPAAG